MKDGQGGPITRAEFEALFQGVNDRSYWEPFVELGEGAGYEAHTQAFEQFARLSLAVDRTTQSLFLLPFSGQTAPPASGGQQASVTLTVTRATAAYYPNEVTLPLGWLVAEEATDHGPDGGLAVQTGRRYASSQVTGFGPGVTTPIEVPALAEQVGTSYNFAQVGTLTSIVQVGAGFQNTGASLIPGLTRHQLVLAPVPDVIAASMVGSYVLLTGGANLGAIRRIVDYRDPRVTPTPDGGTAFLGATGVYQLATVGGQFLPGEVCEQPATGAQMTVVWQAGPWLVADRLVAPNFMPGLMVVGLQSGAAAIPSAVAQSPDLSPETGTASWRVLDWAADFGIQVTNAAQPTGGLAATLDELASEIGVGRNLGETDDQLRDRCAQPVDLVTPPAVLRAANRVLAPYGLSAVLREVGQSSLPGLYLDGDPSSADPARAFYFDVDPTLTPSDAWKLLLDYREFRAFFLVGVPQSDLGEFGAAFDVGASNAFDCAPQLCFFDGFPLTFAALMQTVWQEVNRTRAFGVGFDLVLD